MAGRGSGRSEFMMFAVEKLSDGALL